MGNIRGFIALTSVLILSAIFLYITISIASRAISSSSIQIAFQERDNAKYNAEGCLSYALMELQRTFEYVGDEGILVGNGTCNILSLSEDATQPRTVQVESTVGNHTYRLEADIAEVAPQVYVTSIERVETF